LNDGSRSDQRHLPGKNIGQLGQLIKAELAHQPAEARDARIIAQLLIGRPFAPGVGAGREKIKEPAFRIGMHRAQLDACEWLPVAANPALDEKDRPRALQPQGKGHDEQKRQGQPEQHGTTGQIGGPLETGGQTGKAAPDRKASRLRKTRARPRQTR
jgi:hypothetical protein